MGAGHIPHSLGGFTHWAGSILEEAIPLCLPPSTRVLLWGLKVKTPLSGGSGYTQGLLVIPGFFPPCRLGCGSSTDRLILGILPYAAPNARKVAINKTVTCFTLIIDCDVFLLCLAFLFFIDAHGSLRNTNH